jgi:diguanylate cyclase (GGDEF)-like protein
VRGAARVWPLAGCLAGVAAALYVTQITGFGTVSAPFELPWWSLVIAFALVDACMVHLQFRREAHSFTLAEIPLTFGLFFVGPAVLIPARLAGGLLALALVRRQRPVKLAFNLSLFALEGCLAVTLFHLLTTRPGLSWTNLGVALAALSVATIAGALAVVCAISLAEGRLRAAGLLHSVTLGLVITVANASIALMGVAVVWTDPALGLLLLVPAVVLFVSYRAYLHERQRRASLEFLYQTTRALHHADSTPTAVSALLAATRDAFRAGVAEIVMFPSSPDTPAVRSVLGPGDDAKIERSLAATVDVESVSEDDRAVLISRVHKRKRLALPRLPTADTMVAPLSGDRKIIGRLTVRDRLGDVRPFDEHDLRLFETLANHAGVALEVITLAEDLRHAAYHDSLTQLPNRALLHKHLAALFERADDAIRPGVLVMDLDDFKTINDSLGHAAGDELLVGLTERLLALLDGDEHVARLGGDEFAVVMSHTGDDGVGRARRLAHAILGAVQEPFVLEGKEITVNASIGLATLTSATQGPEDVLRNADLAMYKAKELGKGRFEAFEAQLHDSALKRLEMRRDVRLAFERDEFILHYQPILQLDSGEIAGVEALARWQHPERGLLPPETFLPTLEETGLIVEVGGWVLRRALRQARSWQTSAASFGDLGIAINLSVVQLQRPTFVDDVASAIAEEGIDPSTVTLEITESVFMEDNQQALQRLRALKQIGVRLAIDDFGTGYSSLRYLARFPIDTLKIARQFVADSHDGSRQAALVAATTGIGRSLGLRTVAEGIEDPRQRDFVRELGCELGQGFLFSKPLDADGITALLLDAGQKDQDSPVRVVRLRPGSAAA